jgi:hypothetical protein
MQGIFLKKIRESYMRRSRPAIETFENQGIGPKAKKTVLPLYL